MSAGMPSSDTAGAPSETDHWVGLIMRARNTTGPGLVALAKRLDDEHTPPALRALARAYVEERLYRADRPRARSGDPETSHEAAEAARGPAKPGGTVHRILATYAEHAASPSLAREAGLTSREVESRSRVRAAHKRTSELLADGLLEVVTLDEKRLAEAFADGVSPPYRADGNGGKDAVRGGGRILRITDDGRTELARLDAAKRVKVEAADAKAARAQARADLELRWKLLETLRTRDGFQRLDEVGFTVPELARRLDESLGRLAVQLNGLRGGGLVEIPSELDDEGVVTDTPLWRRGYSVHSITDAGVVALERRERQRARRRARSE